MCGLRKGLRSGLDACMLALLCGLPAAGAQTLGDMIDQAKWAKRLQQAGALPGAVAPPPGGPARGAPVVPPVPMLWSLQGMDGHFEAILIHGTRAYLVRSDHPPSFRVGPWSVQQLDEAGVWLNLPSVRRKSPVHVPPPVHGASAYAFARRLGTLPSAAPTASAAAPLQAGLSGPQAQAAQLPVAQPPNTLPAAAPAATPE